MVQVLPSLDWAAITAMVNFNSYADIGEDAAIVACRYETVSAPEYLVWECSEAWLSCVSFDWLSWGLVELCLILGTHVRVWFGARVH